MTGNDEVVDDDSGANKAPDSDDHHYIIDRADLEDGDRVVASVAGREIAVFNVDGEFYALSNYCVHQGGPACKGRISGTLAVDEDDELVWDRDGEVVSCPWHGWEFDITDGHHLASERYRLPTYEVVVANDEIYVRL